MRRTTLIVIALGLALLAPSSVALAQPSDGRAPRQDCAPSGDSNAPTVGGGPARDLSDKLADSQGVICPPPSGDRDMQVAPPGGGKLKVIPPPGSPGGDQSVQPK